MLQLGASGSDVGVAQQALLEAGLSIDPGELERQEFGASTEAAVFAFQAAHVDLQGHALGRDGVIGPATAWALEHPGATAAPAYTAPGWRADLASEPEEARQILAAAIAEIGVTEQPDGSNRGPRVDVYTAPTSGIPWCAAFVSWAWARRPEGSPFGKKIYSVHELADWGQAHGRIVTEPRPGDVWCIFRDQVHGHAGLVVLVDGNRVMTVEGNAGNAVRGLIRPVSSIARFVRPIGEV